MPDSTPRCINQGGEASRIQLPQVPQLDQEITVGSQARTALAVWQARTGEIFTVVDPEQNEYRARITELGETHATLFPFAALQRSESPIAIEVFQALPAKERFELVLQKCTEIGNTRIVPFTCSRSSTQQERDAGQKKSHRWPDVLLRAARQCRRALIPELYPVLEWSQALQMAAGAELALLCFEGEGCWPLGEALQGFRGRRIALVVGPEGGFSQEEVEQARGRGILPISLGPRILRTETAAIVASGAIQYALGDLGRVGC